MLRNLSFPPEVLDAMRNDWNRRAEEDAYFYVAFAQRHQDDAAFQSTASTIIPVLEAELVRLPSMNPAARRCLEIGCGPGRLLGAMSPYFAEVHGVDVSDKMISRATELLRDVTNAKVHVCSGTDLALFGDTYFDFVYSFLVFQHIPSKEVVLNYLRETGRVLRPGGIFCGQFQGWSPPGPVDSWSGCNFTADEIAEFAMSNGLQLLALSGEGTQYTVATLRKPSHSLKRDGSNMSLLAATGLDGSRQVPQRGPRAGVTLWISGAPSSCDLNGLKVRFNSGPAVRGCYVSPVDPEGVCQLNVLFPKGLAAGTARLALEWRGQPIAETHIDILPAQPRNPKVVSITDGENLLLESRINSGTLRLTLEDVEDPALASFELDGHAVVPHNIAPLNAGTDQYCYTIQLPANVVPGKYALKVRLGELVLPPRDLQIGENGDGGILPTLASDMNVQQVVREIHARLEENEDIASLSAREDEELTSFRSAYGRLFQMRNALGQMPPAPNTIRAKIGRHLIRVVQRCLFWYTPQIVRFQNEDINALDCAGNLIAWQVERTAALEKNVQKLRAEQLQRTATIENHVQKLRTEQLEHMAVLEKNVQHLHTEQLERTAPIEREVQNLRAELAAVRSQVNRVETTAVAAVQIRERRPDLDAEREDSRLLPNAFQFALQDRFRGSERETIGKLQPYLCTIREEAASLPKAPWLDIGCGRGEWLEAAATAGFDAFGIDSNPAALARCREKGLTVEEGDALEYLLSRESESLAVVTAFHAVEHWPMGYFLALMQEAVRTLRPGGLMMVETPNPTNLRMASFHFWHDPTHTRVIPPALMEFVFEYFGLTKVKRLDLNPSPPNEFLPFDEISVVHRLNEYLHGPQDYGLIGRR